MKQMLVSVLVPVYGVERYIERCAKSLLSQTYENIEYIFINDCTKDRSIELLENTVSLFPNRKNQVSIIHHNQNRGLAAARNTGIEKAHGEFILWVDSDDFVDVRLVEKLVEKQVINNADIVCSDIQMCLPNACKLSRNSYEENPIKFIKNIFEGRQNHWIWGKLIRKSLYSDHNISAEEGCNMGEDLQVFPRLVYYSNTIDFVKEALCFYECSNTSSYCKTINENHQMQKWRSYDIIYSFFKDTDLCEYLEFSAANIIYFHLKTFFIKEGLSEAFFYMLKSRWSRISTATISKLPLKYLMFSRMCFFLGPTILKTFSRCFIFKG